MDGFQKNPEVYTAIRTYGFNRFIGISTFEFPAKFELQFERPCRASVVEPMEARRAHFPKLVAPRSRNTDRLGAFGVIHRIWRKRVQQKEVEPG